MRAPVEQVIQTGTKVFDGRLDSQEAVTILATLARDAVTAAGRLRRTDPERAASYGAILAALEDGLRGGPPGGTDAANRSRRFAEAVADDLGKVRRALADS